MRGGFVRLHRYAGLALAAFLTVAGLTGSLLAWYPELDAALNPELLRVAPPLGEARPLDPLDPLELRGLIARRYPGARVNDAPLHTRPGKAVTFWLEAPAAPDGSASAEPPNDEIFVDPYTGAILGERKWGDLAQGAKNLMPFVYRLHYSLALGTVGETLMGIVALLWTVDCFAGAYLTFPAARRPDAAAHGAGKTWLARWRPAWRVRWRGGARKLVYDLHRAGGLWPWVMLFVLAWSSVAFNLKEVYRPVMGALFAMQPTAEAVIPGPAAGRPEPALSWAEGLAVGRRLMAALAESGGFRVLREEGLSYDPEHGVFNYRVMSTRDVGDRYGATSIRFDAATGELQGSHLPTGAAAGDTLDTWFTSLHTAALWGWPMKLFVCGMGLAVALLSVTGVILWWRKRAARYVQGRIRTRPPAPGEADAHG